MMNRPKTCLITGASSGMGYYLAKTLACQGNSVIAAVRNTFENRNLIDLLHLKCKSINPQGSVFFAGIELSDIESVLHSAQRIQKQFPIIDVLICNAGVMNPPWKLTEDNYEIQFQTNFLSHFYLTLQLKEQLLLSDDPRIINICSSSAEKGKIDNMKKLEEISRVSKESYIPIKSYRESKLAQLTSVYALSAHPDWQKIKISAIHPGVVNTSLFYRNHGLWFELIMKPFVWLGYLSGKIKTIEKGADTALWLATKEKAETGYWHERKQRNPNPIVTNTVYRQEMIDHYKKNLAM